MYATCDMYALHFYAGAKNLHPSLFALPCIRGNPMLHTVKFNLRNIDAYIDINLLATVDN